MSDVEDYVDEALRNNPTAALDYEAGEDGAINFLIGQVLQASRGAVDPAKAESVIRERLDNASMREIARGAYIQGYKDGHGVENVKDITIRTADDKFSRWWDVNYEK